MGITKQELIENPNDKTKKMYKEFGLMLEEVIQKGLDIIVSLNKSKVTGWEKNQQQTMISILKEIFEKIDGIIILAEKYSQQNISVLARSVLEGFLDLNFMLKKPKRALAYIYCKSLDYLPKYDEISKIEFTKEELKLLQEELGEELKKQRGKKKESNDYKLNWKSFYFERNKDDFYWFIGAKIQYRFLCAETHNQTSLIHNYSENDKFDIRGFRVNDKIGIGFISQMVAGFSGEIFERIIKLYIQDNLSDLKLLEKWRKEMIEKSEELIKLDNERLAGTTRVEMEI